MQWVPDTIDALARLYHETGAGGFVALGGVLGIFMLVLAVVVILTRNSGQVVTLAQQYLTRAEAANVTLKTIAESNATIAASNAKIETLTQDVKERVGKIPSEPLPCRFKEPLPEQIIDTARALLEIAGGVVLTKGEAEMVLAHREEVRKAKAEMDAAAAKRTADMPVFKPA